MKQAIVQTLAYFDIFSYPLTRQEVQRCLWSSSDMSESIEELIDRGAIHDHGAYISLQSDPSVVAARERKVTMTEERFKIAQKAAKKLRYIPFLQAVFICNQLPITVKESSDIDVFIVIKKGRLWLTRFLATAILSLFKMRRHGECVDKHVCLSFYITDDALDLSSIAIGETDIYLVYWLAFLLPLYDPNNMSSVILEKNTWAKKFIPHMWGHYQEPHRLFVQDAYVSKIIKAIGEYILGGALGNWCEQKARTFQKNKMKQNEKKHKASASRSVIISDQMLKFHENDRRDQFKTQWQTICQKYL